MLGTTFVLPPVGHLARSRTGFQASGFSLNAQFSEDTATCSVMSESSCAMRLTHTKIGEFTRKGIADARQSTEVLIARSADPRQEAQDLVDRAIDPGGRKFRPAQHYGFMFGRAFEDRDGHIREIVGVDPASVEA